MNKKSIFFFSVGKYFFFPLLVQTRTSSAVCNDDAVSRYSCFISNLRRKTSTPPPLGSVFFAGSLKMPFTKSSVSRNSLWFLSWIGVRFCQILFLCLVFWSFVNKIYYFKWLRIRYWHFCYRILSSNLRLYVFLHKLSYAYFYNIYIALRSCLFWNYKLSYLLYKPFHLTL